MDKLELEFVGELAPITSEQVGTETFPDARGYVRAHMVGVQETADVIEINGPADVSMWGNNLMLARINLDEHGILPTLLLWAPREAWSEVIEDALGYCIERGWNMVRVTADDLGADDWREMMARMENGTEDEYAESEHGFVYDSAAIHFGEVRGYMADLAECPICGETARARDVEMQVHHDPRARTLYNHSGRMYLAHGHVQIAQYDLGIRPSEEMLQVAIGEMTALLDRPLSADDLALVEKDAAEFSEDDYEAIQWVYETAESNLRAGYVAFFDSDSGTWELWALDRAAFYAALDLYAAEANAYVQGELS